MKRFRDLLDLARAEGLVGARIIVAGKHARLVGTDAAGRAVRLVISISPRMPSVQGLKIRADLRRAHRESGKVTA